MALTRLRALPSLALCLLACACGAPREEAPPSGPAQRPAGMKGWELYTFRADGDAELRWTILVGTNRLKGPEEIVSPGEDALPGTTTGRGVEALVAELARFERGAWVMWNFRQDLLPGGRVAWPDDADLARLRATAAQAGVQLELADR